MNKLVGNTKRHGLLYLLSPSPPRYERVGDPSKAEKGRKGYVPVLVGGEAAFRERFLIPTRLMAHPSILALLQMSAEEFGYHQQGVLRIPCDPDCFREMLNALSSSNVI